MGPQPCSAPHVAAQACTHAERLDVLLLQIIQVELVSQLKGQSVGSMADFGAYA